MARLLDVARRVAPSELTVLVTGETGSGKERIARLLHEESRRARGPFIAVNCGAITETLFESELFGHARGAFTGATEDRAGLFEAANGGTLLLDEVGELSPGIQVKLLRALQEREIRRVGENRSRRIDARIIASTNRDLAHGGAGGPFRGAGGPFRGAGGPFREDLYYRLKVIELHVPALRERPDDVLPLALALLAGAALRLEGPPLALEPDAARRLLGYGWPGNVRELKNAMERAVALARHGCVAAEDLPEELRETPAAAPAAAQVVRRLDEVEKEHILAVLALNDGNQTHTAAQLRIGSATLYRKLKRYGLCESKKLARRGFN